MNFFLLHKYKKNYYAVSTVPVPGFKKCMLKYHTTVHPMRILENPKFTRNKVQNFQKNPKISSIVIFNIQYITLFLAPIADTKEIKRVLINIIFSI